MAWNQGVDLYGYDNNRILAAAEYVAMGNLELADGGSPAMPYRPYYNGNVYDTQFAAGSQQRPAWALIYNHYVNRRGLSAPYTERTMRLVQPEWGANPSDSSGGFDQLGYGTLTFTRDAIARGAPPSGLTATASQGRVVLSWWGTSGADSYSVKRSDGPGDPYIAIASALTEPRTFTDAPDAGTFYYIVTAQTGAGESAPSNEARAVTAVQLHTWLTFDEDAGAVAHDVSGEGHHGLVDGGAKWVAGKHGNALQLDGTSGYVALPEDLLVDLGDFTIAAWLYLDSEHTWARLFDFGAGTGQYMFLAPNGGAPRFAVTRNLGVGETGTKSSVSLVIGQWVHLAVTVQGWTATLYVNGLPVGSNVWTIPVSQLGHTPNNWLGRSQFPSDPYLAGRIDDFRIYRGVLSPAEVTELAAP